VVEVRKVLLGGTLKTTEKGSVAFRSDNDQSSSPIPPGRNTVLCPFLLFPYGIAALVKLPTGEDIFAAYHFETIDDIGIPETLEVAPVLRFNELLDAPRIHPSAYWGRSTCPEKSVGYIRHVTPSGDESWNSDIRPSLVKSTGILPLRRT